MGIIPYALMAYGLTIVISLAVVAVIVTLGTVTQRSFRANRQADYNYDAYKDTYTDPQSAYGTVSEALQIVSESFQKSQVHDSDSVSAPLKTTGQ